MNFKPFDGRRNDRKIQNLKQELQTMQSYRAQLEREMHKMAEKALALDRLIETKTLELNKLAK